MQYIVRLQPVLSEIPLTIGGGCPYGLNLGFLLRAAGEPYSVPAKIT
ncbi:MAG: hypothetical protein ACO3NK_14835 [Prochlorotrichaceae cyanobacterium]